jgi:hypothetical protein
MDVTYDPHVDALRVVLSSRLSEESDEDKPGVILDYILVLGVQVCA